MPQDPARLEELAALLLRRANDLHYVGHELVRHANKAEWRCAKATRFREAMQARRSEATRLALELRDLVLYLRARSQAANG